MQAEKPGELLRQLRPRVGVPGKYGYCFGQHSTLGHRTQALRRVRRPRRSEFDDDAALKPEGYLIEGCLQQITCPCVPVAQPGQYQRGRRYARSHQAQAARDGAGGRGWWQQ